KSCRPVAVTSTRTPLGCSRLSTSPSSLPSTVSVRRGPFVTWQRPALAGVEHPEDAGDGLAGLSVHQSQADLDGVLLLPGSWRVAEGTQAGKARGGRRNEQLPHRRLSQFEGRVRQFGTHRYLLQQWARQVRTEGANRRSRPSRLPRAEPGPCSGAG